MDGDEIYPCATWIPFVQNFYIFLYPYHFWLCLLRTELLAFVKFLALEKEFLWIVWKFYELYGNFIYLKRETWDCYF